MIFKRFKKNQKQIKAKIVYFLATSLISHLNKKKTNGINSNNINYFNLKKD